MGRLILFGLMLWTSVVYAGTEISLREKIGQMLMVGFHGKRVTDPGVQRVAAQIKAGEVGGVILFAYNIGTLEETQAMVSFLKSQSRFPLRVAVDQEGGQVARIRTTRFPSAKDMAKKSVTEAGVLYTQMAEMLYPYGINVVLGPVVDLDYDPPSPAIGVFSRSYGTDSETVVSYASAFVTGMRRFGMVSALKHFPGHGSAQGDTHHGLVDTTAVWSSRELGPYQAMLDVEMVMVSHIVNLQLDPTGTPASLSYPVVTTLLRHQLGYAGVVITDDLQMGAIRSLYDLPEVAVRAVLAGNDILLFGNNTAIVPVLQKDTELPSRVLGVIESAVSSGVIPMSRIEAAYARISELRLRSGPGATLVR